MVRRSVSMNSRFQVIKSSGGLQLQSSNANMSKLRTIDDFSVDQLERRETFARVGTSLTFVGYANPSLHHWKISKFVELFLNFLSNRGISHPLSQIFYPVFYPGLLCLEDIAKHCIK